MSSQSPVPPGAAPDPRDVFFSTDEIMGNLGRRAGNASTLILVMMAVKFVLQMGSIAVIARLVPPAEQGIIAMAMPVMMIAMTLSNFGLAQAMVQRKDMTHELATTLFWLNAIFGLSFAGLVALLGAPAAGFYDQPKVAAVFWTLSVTVILASIAGQYIAILRRRMRILAVELTNLGGMVAGIVAAIAAALAGWGYWAIVVQQIVNGVVMLALLLVAVSWLPSGLGAVRFGKAREALKFGGFLAGANLVKMISDSLPVVFAGRLFGETSAGLLYRANGLADIPRTKILIPLSGAFVPTLSRLQDDPPEFRAMFARLVNRANLLLLPVAVGVSAAAEPITAFLLGQDWSAAAPLLALLGVRVFFVGLQDSLRWCFIATGRTRPLLIVSVVNLALVALAVYVGATGGLLAMTAAYVAVQVLVTLPVLIGFALRQTPMRLATLRKAALVDLLFAFALAGAVWALRQRLPEMSAFAELLVLGAVIALAFAGKVVTDRAQRNDVFTVLSRVLYKFGRVRRAP